MPLVPAKCTQCGGIVEVDDTHEAGICTHCGMPFIIEKAINIYGGISPDFVIRAGTLEQYNGVGTEIVIPNSVKTIGQKCFAKCKNITSVAIPDSVTSIDFGAFEDCEGLTTIEIPNSVTFIGSFAFARCKGLKSITLSNNLKTIESWAFCHCSNLTIVNIPNCVNKIGLAAFCDCTKLEKVTIPQSVNDIEFDTFSNCINLKEVTVPKHLAEDKWDIRDRAFKGCSSSLRIYLPDGTMVMKKEEPKKQSNGCYIATCVYGSYDCPEVWTLRRFRDDTLDSTLLGKAFIKFYYSVSPGLVRIFGKQAWFKKMWKTLLDKAVVRLNNNGVSDTPYHDKY